MPADLRLVPDQLLPTDEQRTPEDDLAGAVASALNAEVAVEEPPLIPLGRSWAFDWRAGRFKRQGGAPAEVRGIDALKEWLEMARRTKRGAHACFSNAFGMEGPEDWMGHVNVDEATADYGADLEETWGVHDRVAAVVDYRAHFEEDEETIVIDELRVVTDLEGARPVSMAGPAPLLPE